MNGWLLLDLYRQVKSVLQPRNGGNGSAYGEGRVVIHMLNSTGSSIALWSCVEPTGGDNGQHIQKVTAANSKTTIGVCVGYYVGDELVEAACPDGSEMAVQTAGKVRCLIESAVTRQDYGYSAATDGTIASSSSGTTAGIFCLILESADTSTGQTTAWIQLPITVAPASGSSGSVATDAIWDAKGDLAAGTGANTAAKVTVGADDTILMADSAQATGLKWVASASPSAVGTAAATGTADTFTRGDHVHAHEVGHVVHDTIWDAKGDLAAGTGADAAAKLTVGSDDQILMADAAQSSGLKWVGSQTPSSQAFSDAASQGTADTYARGDHKHGMMADPTGSGGGGIGAGASFPGSPATNDIYRRTDLALLFYFDGTRWLSLAQYEMDLGRVGDGTEPATATKNAQYWQTLGQTLWIEAMYVGFFVAGGGTALGASHKWVGTLTKWDTSGVQGSAIATINIDSGSSAVFRMLSSTGINSASLANDTILSWNITKTGTPGNLYAKPRILYRLIAT